MRTREDQGPDKLKNEDGRRRKRTIRRNQDVIFEIHRFIV